MSPHGHNGTDLTNAGGDEPASTPQRALAGLGARLRHLREDADLSGRDLARAVGWHSSKVSRIEHGTRQPSAADIELWCEVTGTPERAEELIATMRVVDSLFTEWRQLESPGLASLQESLLPTWERTQTFRFYSLFVIPTPVQTPDYARAILTYVRDRHGTIDDVDAAVDLRMLRQDRALHGAGHRFVLVLEESALYYGAGTAEVMAGQLGHLLAVSALPHLSLGIIPTGTDRSLARPVEGFCLFDDREVEVELVSGSLQITQPRDVAMYADHFRDLAALAVRGPQARTIINRAIAAVDA